MPTTTTFPNGQTLTSTALTVTEINTLLQAVTTQIFGLTSSAPNFNSAVRLDWPTDGQPAWQITDDVCFVACTPIDSDYSNMRDITGTADADEITQVDVFTRAWNVAWTFYGPNSLDRARLVRSAMVTIQMFVDHMSEANLYINPSVDEPRRTPERYASRWWERVDLAAQFNEQVTETYTVGTVESVEVSLNTKAGQFADFTVAL